jgi:hypothetical protein
MVGRWSKIAEKVGVGLPAGDGRTAKDAIGGLLELPGARRAGLASSLVFAGSPPGEAGRSTARKCAWVSRHYQAQARAMACKASPTPAPTTVPLMRMNCRSRPRSSSSWLDVSVASHRSIVPVTRPASSSWN